MKNNPADNGVTNGLRCFPKLPSAFIRLIRFIRIIL